MYSGSLATIRIGRYVSGSATAENTTEYSVTRIGSTPVTSTAAPATTTHDHHDVEARGLGGPAELAPRPAEELRQRVAARQRGLQRGAERRGDDADDDERQRDLAAGRDHRQHDLGQRRHLDLPGQQHDAAHAGDGDRQQPAEREPDQHVEPGRAEVLDRSTAPRRRPRRRRTPRTGVIAAPNSAIA